MSNWRWDQGRLQYFNLYNLKKIAEVLVLKEGQHVGRGAEEDFLREDLAIKTDLPFAPDSYTVWRNYARVFKVSLLAVRNSEGKLQCTDICKSLAGGRLSRDEDTYLWLLATRFYNPSPCFNEYSSVSDSSFPIISILKLLVVKSVKEPTI